MLLQEQFPTHLLWIIRTGVAFVTAVGWRFTSHVPRRWLLAFTACVVLLPCGYLMLHAQEALTPPLAFGAWTAGLVVLGSAAGWVWRSRFVKARTQVREEAGLVDAASLPSIRVRLPTASSHLGSDYDLVFDDPQLWVASIHSTRPPIRIPLDLCLRVDPVWDPGRGGASNGVSDDRTPAQGSPGGWLVEVQYGVRSEWPIRCCVAETSDRARANAIANQITEWADAVTKGVGRPAAGMRAIADARALLDVVLQSLDSFQAEVRSEPSALEALWDAAASAQRRPKREYALSNALDRHFRRELQPRGITSFREAEVWPGVARGVGQRVDLFVCAAVPGSAPGMSDIVVVAIEVKLDDHDRLRTAMADQLVNRYLRSTRRAQHGIYVVGFYAGGLYEPSRAPTLPTLAAELDAQASSLSTPDMQVRARVLNLALPSGSAV